MQRVQIECCDWRDCLERFSGPGWLAYCDPPYVAGVRKAGGYEHELRDSDHEALIETLLRYRGAVVLSGYDNALYAPAGGRRMGQNGTRGVLQRRGPDTPQRPPGRGKGKGKAKAR